MIRTKSKEMVFDELTAPTPSCHASTVLPLPNGDVVVSWFGGKEEGDNDVDVWVSVKSGGKWQKAVRVTADPNVPHWNPVLFLRQDGVIYLYFKVGQKVPVWGTWLSKSNDGGITWSEPFEIVPGDENNGRGPVKNKNIRLSDGRVLAPASSEHHRKWLSFTDTSTDDGDTWERQADVATGDEFVPMIQPSLWESAPGKVHMLTRTARGYIYRSDSEDYGQTWSEAYKTDLLNNNSGLDLDRDDKGGLYLVSNPIGEDWGARTPLTLMHSADNGDTWEEILVLEDEPGEYSYPAIVYKDGKLHITYTWKREKVAYWLLELND
ncbi:MAG: exo-alpha-sialidase [Clostridiales bacterium]|nr:exo-alpha-sialidase [Clostridiales bacterium]